MEDNPLLAALRESYGAPPEEADTNTVRGLLKFCRGWSQGEISAEALNDPCWAMAGRLRQAAEATFRDLEQNPDLGDEAREPLLVMGEAFEAIASLLERLITLAAENRIEEYLGALEEFEEERLAVLDANEEIQWQMSGRELRCPKCGAEGSQSRCEVCGLTLLYPDSSQLQDYSRKSASLSPLHQRVFAAYLGVREGRESLETLLATLPALIKHLESMLRVCKKELQGGGAAWASALGREIEVGLRGAHRMASVADTLRTSDLNRGWEDLFESSVATSRELSRLTGSPVTASTDEM